MKSLLLFIFLLGTFAFSGCNKTPVAIIDSDIQGATVWLDDQIIGKTPLALYPSDLKELGLPLPYRITQGKYVWQSWDYRDGGENNMTITDHHNSQASIRRITFTLPPKSDHPLAIVEGKFGKNIETYGMNYEGNHFTVLFSKPK